MCQKPRQHIFYPKEFPESWASGWGEDEYGIWMEFTYKGVVQRFRWCEPGTFLMGSPEDEPERLNNEIQHKVTFTRGFWIADTVVTQILWKLVMGSNPSRFKGEDRPVENVSWGDAQSFIQKMNEIRPELRLCLPSEAQWEYACRAGSSTQFCWGEQINSRLVNFDGNYPYNNGRKSEYRKETVEVKSYYQNDWGLWQTHGNVDEWCEDWYGDYPAEPIVDPIGPNSGDNRVMRGGSWIDFGGDCRSADRSISGPPHRLNYTGFRLARGALQVHDQKPAFEQNSV